MKHLLFVLLMCSATNVFAQAPKVDTVVTEELKGLVWETESRLVYSYDANCQLTSILYQEWDTVTHIWVNAILTSYTYISGDYISEAITQKWSKAISTWSNRLRQTYSYDGSFKLLMIVTDEWLNNDWKLSSQTTYSYDVNGYADSVLTQVALFGPLQNASLSVYDNNSDGTPDTVIIKGWNLITSTWDNNLRTSYAYNADKTINQMVTESWNFVSGIWENAGRTIYSYNAGYLTLGLRQVWSSATSTWDDNRRDIYSYTSSCTLPLKLLVFTASRNNNTVTLSWQTTEEINTSHFTVQRSTDGINFSSLGNVTARNNPQTNYYGFTDNIEKVTGDKVYYRLQMIDKDGKFTYSKIIPLTLELYAGKIKTYPNPVKDQLYILFNIQNAAKAELRITDATGKTVRSQRVDASLNNNAVGVNVASLGKGVYYVLMITDKGIQRTQFIKQ